MNRTNVYETIGSLLGVCYQYITITLHGVILAAWLCLSPSTSAQTAVQKDEKVQKVMSGGIQVDTSDRLVSRYKVEAALALAFELSNRYQFIPNSVRDSLARAHVPDSLTIQRAADTLGAEIIVFSNLGRIANLVRMETVILGGDGWIANSSGVGYAVSFYEGDSIQNRVLDPAILLATQRSLCVALLDSNLYASADSSLRATPTMLMAVGGIEFIDTDSELAPWSIFREKLSASYDIAQTIVSALRTNNAYTVIDLDTRDSIYALAGLFMVENYNVASRTELTTLKAFDVKSMISGKLERKRGGAELTLSISEIQADASYTSKKRASVTVQVDSKLAMQDGVRACLRKLFASISEPKVRKR